MLKIPSHFVFKQSDPAFILKKAPKTDIEDWKTWIRYNKPNGSERSQWRVVHERYEISGRPPDASASAAEVLPRVPAHFHYISSN